MSQKKILSSLEFGCVVRITSNLSSFKMDTCCLLLPAV